MSLRHAWLAAALLAASSFVAADEPRIQYLKPEGLFNVPSFSQVTVARPGTLVFVSGQISWDDNGRMLAGDLRAQTEATFENLKIALAAAGATFDDVAKLTIYVKNLDTRKWREVSEVRSRYLSTERPPASTMVGITSLVYDEALIEIEAYAVLDD
jgi:enamine deaminase RidA (YjgF/YER057c/UK114 family)